MLDFQIEDAERQPNINGNVYVSNEARKHLGMWFETVLIFRGYEVHSSEALLVTAVLNGGREKQIDPTCNGLTCNDELLHDELQLLKSLICLEQVSVFFAKDEYQKRGYRVLKTAYKYLQIKVHNPQPSQFFKSANDVVKALENSYELQELPKMDRSKFNMQAIIRRFMKFDAFTQNKNAFSLELSTYMLLINPGIKMKDRYPEIGMPTEQKIRFEELLKNSLSLNYEEKLRVIRLLPTLSSFQIRELANVFEEESQKYLELSKEHPDDIKKLLNQCRNNWTELQKTQYFEEVAK